MTCVMCGKEITEKEQERLDYFHGESLEEYWCRPCGLEETAK